MSQSGRYRDTVSPSGPIETITGDTGAPVTPVAGNINILGGSNINTVGGGDTLTINLDDIVNLPVTNAAGTQGQIQFGGTRFLSELGTDNTFLGGNSGNLTLTTVLATDNTGIGSTALQSLTIGAGNTALGSNALTTVANGGTNTGLGYHSLHLLTSGNNNVGVGAFALDIATTAGNNTAIGNNALNSLLTGGSNIAVGFNAGADLVGAEEFNILIGNRGVLGDSNTIRIGNAVDHVLTFIQGIYANTPAATRRMVVINSTGEMGTIGGSNGQVLIGATGASPAFANITSSDASIVITNGANSVDLTTAGSVSDTFVTDSGVASPNGGILNILGGNNIVTSGAADTVTIDLNGTTNHAVQVGNASASLTSLGVGTNGQVLVGATAANPAFATLTSSASTLTYTTGVNTLNIDITAPVSVSFGGTGRTSLTNHSVLVGATTAAITQLGVGTNGQVLIGATAADPAFATLTSTGSTITYTTGANTLNLETSAATPNVFHTDSGDATPSAHALTIAGGANISTSGAGSTVTVKVSGTTNHAVQIGNGTASLTSLGVGTNGQVLIGATAADPAFAALTSTGGTISFTTGANTLNLEATGFAFAYTNVTSTPYVVLSTDQYLSVNSGTGAKTIQLPNAPTTNRTFVIKDRTGNATANNITVTTVGGVVTIDGTTSFVMNTNYLSIQLLFNGVSYEIF